MTDVDQSSFLRHSPTAATSGNAVYQNPQKTWQDGDTASFKDILAVINPLQHIPIVGTIYRAITGDQIAAMPSIIGGTIFGGPIGLALSLVDNALKGETGKNVGETVVAGLFGSSKPADAPAGPMVAAAQPQPTPDKPKLSIDIPAPRPGERAPQPFADGKPPVIIDLPQPKWAQDAGGARGGSTPKQTAQQAAADAAPPAVPTVPVVKAGMPLAFQSASAIPTIQPQAPALPASPPLGKPAQKGQTAQDRFRSTDLPSPETVPSAQARAGDLIGTPVGTPITRDAVPGAMQSALDKYATMMRARTAQNTPTQVSLVR